MIIKGRPAVHPRDTAATVSPEPTSANDIGVRSAETRKHRAAETESAASESHSGRSPEADLNDSQRILSIDPPSPADKADAHTAEPSAEAIAGAKPEPRTDPATTPPGQSEQTPDAPPAPGTESAAEHVESGDHAERREPILDTLTSRHGLDTDTDRTTVGKAFDAARAHLAPVIVHATSKILDDCKSLIADRPDTVIVFLGRDAHTMALAAQELEPEIFSRHCTEAPISRCLADTVVQDLENNADKTFPEVENFRGARGDVKPDDIPGSRATMTRFLESRGIPVGTPGANIIFVDTSFKGSVQSLMSVTYPEVNIHGMYLVHTGSEGDPHADSKKGYLLHQTADGAVASHDAAIPTELAATLSDKDTVLAIEQALRGPYSKAERFGHGAAPEQHLEAPPLGQINPLDVSPAYLDTNVRLAVMDANQAAVADYAREIAQRRSAGEDVSAELAAGTESGLRQVRSWATRSVTDTDPDFAEMMNSIVRREDKHIVRDLHTAIEASGLDPPQAHDKWLEYQQLDTNAAKEAFLSEFHRRPPTTGAEHG